MAKQKEIVEELGKLNEVIYHSEHRPDGTVSHALDFSNCPSMAEQHTAHLTDINYLMEKYQPDELAAYLAARNQYRQEILGHDFSSEPSLQDAKNSVLALRTAYENLKPELRNQFKNHVEFLKYIDNPANKEKLIKLGLLKESEINKLTPQTPPPPNINTNANDSTNANTNSKTNN